MSEEDNDNLTLIVDKEASGKRIDSFLTSKLPQKSRSYIQKLINAKLITIDGKTVDKSYRVAAGEKINVREVNKFEINPYVKPEAIKLKIKYEDDYLLVLSKEPGISVHPSPGYYQNTIVNALLYYYKTKNIDNDFIDVTRAGLVHRLDKDTSGLLIAAKNSEVQMKLSLLFKNRQIKKVYTTLVLGTFSEKIGRIILPIGRSRVDRKKMSVSIDRGREAITEFEVLENFNYCTLLKVFPKTGRTHQIRVHLSYINHPVIGDSRYGNKESEKIAKQISLKRQFLHASKLSFTHPVLNKIIEIEDDLSDDLIRSLEILREIGL